MLIKHDYTQLTSFYFHSAIHILGVPVERVCFMFGGFRPEAREWSQAMPSWSGRSDCIDSATNNFMIMQEQEVLLLFYNSFV